MKDYIICTDSGCDIRRNILEEWGVPYVELTFRFDQEDKDYTDKDIAIKDFYDRMKEGSIAKTSAVNPDTFTGMFEQHVSQGKDVLYLGFSSGLSTTCNSAHIAAKELSEQYPDNKVLVVDTLCASAGQGLLLYLVLQKKELGYSVEEAAAYAEEIKAKICHWFTVDDLEYLKRGGRISPTVALVGNVLGVKPVLHVDNEGHLVNKLKVRGRKAALKVLAEKYGELAEDVQGGTVFICNADCMQDVETLKDMIKEKYGAKVELVTDIGPVIGAHAGPGTIAVFFVGKER